MRAYVAAIALIACLSMDGVRAAENTEVPAETPPSKDRDSLALGLAFGGFWKSRFGDDIDVEQVIKGVREAYSDKQSMTQAEAQAIAGRLDSAWQAKQMEKMKKRGEEAKPKGEEYLAANKKKDGVVQTASGLQYKVIKEGEGDPPKPTDVCMVNYKGMFIDGDEFDSSARHGGPVQFDLNRLTPGFKEGLLMMKPGAKYQLVVPPNLAYGDKPDPRSGIAPSSVLVFDVELISINASPAARNAQQNAENTKK
jgi:FKBP-type peptidyl-prolyl cis-trans isomerase